MHAVVCASVGLPGLPLGLVRELRRALRTPPPPCCDGGWAGLCSLRVDVTHPGRTRWRLIARRAVRVIIISWPIGGWLGCRRRRWSHHWLGSWAVGVLPFSPHLWASVWRWGHDCGGLTAMDPIPAWIPHFVWYTLVSTFLPITYASMHSWLDTLFIRYTFSSSSFLTFKPSSTFPSLLFYPCIFPFPPSHSCPFFFSCLSFSILFLILPPLHHPAYPTLSFFPLFIFIFLFLFHLPLSCSQPFF